MLEYTEGADAALTRLENNESAVRLLERVNAVLEHIAEAPGDASVRQFRLIDTVWGPTAVWAVPVPGNDNWFVLWSPGPDPDVQTIAYIGPAPT